MCDNGIWIKVDGVGGVVKIFFDIVYKCRVMVIEGNWFGVWGVEKVFWDILVFKKIRVFFGGSVRGMFFGGVLLFLDI